MAILLVSRLEASVFSTFIILIPIFIGLGCCMCGVVCGICALSCVDMSALDEEAGQAQPGGHVPNNSFGNSDDLEGGLAAQYQMNEKPTKEEEIVLVVPQPVDFPPAVPTPPSPSAPSPALEVTHIDADID